MLTMKKTEKARRQTKRKHGPEDATDADAPTSERAALLDFFTSTNGPKWRKRDGWSTDAPVGTWCGVTVEEGHVVALDLRRHRLAGQLPDSLGNLPSLGLLTLSGNRLTGPLPQGMARLTKLGWLWLDGNRLTGSIPDWLGNITGLTQVYLNKNQFTGSIPASLGNLSKLFVFSMADNPLTGPVPAELGKLDGWPLNVARTGVTDDFGVIERQRERLMEQLSRPFGG
ncbi:MAG: hypothetical protein LBQ20_03220 [Rhodanobacter sp.]|jgi:hypothetical protein|nr:hypothetical protein [Rhodanobacter sp.]